ncbi:ABC transporter ATP-binding protein [Advenella faeciporci]|uniref:ABC transporter ATP-binding protein n=1 Tax=Advenella faeciporci TaxID=797535 RepID=A0A918MY71_9BURK|nr:ABC transporter ATP-binding protein [Advenella faeciporci]GGW84765.1 ABC transporter ATP-binding protein [Advenella faeciporci]
MSVTPLLSCKNLNAGYGASQVLFEVGFTIHAGETVTLLGRNGMGKSTTIKSIMGDLRSKSGEIHFNGRPVQSLKADAIARLGIAIVPEGRLCFPNLTVREHLLAFADQRNGRADGWDIERIYALFPRLKERSSHMGNQLSGGEQQMLAIGRALSTNPRLLILDEATEGLAPVIRDEIWACLAKLRQEGQTTLIVDKYLEKLLALADRHVILERGRVVWEGSSVGLLHDRSLWSRYLGV